ncbi:hypothetical protein Pint_06783 [Pistacia integerrima]|uniref:Uncharacterized protein n=1 Tax=Pistacia integerrima TaxID=434235 RepID=A0ACC0XXJ8_9ROSI|nr:hypothetical protein Pint_06783 [Pistacia integerrima]
MMFNMLLFSHFGINFNVKKDAGVPLLNEKEVEEFNPITNEFPQTLNGSTMDVIAIDTQRPVNNEVATSDDEGEPQL